MSISNIEHSLIKLFDKNRIIFWYDEKEAFKEQFDNLNLTEIHKFHVVNNHFEIKYLVQKAQPKDKFLLYFTGLRPSNEENWLLDLELAHHVFYTDQEAVFLQEIGLDYHFKELVTKHMEFFKAKDRRLKLKDLLATDDTHEEIRYKMLAVTFGVENISLVTFIHAYGTAFDTDKDDFTKELKRYNLADFLWRQIERRYNYHSEKPSIYDFLLEVFNNNFIYGERTGLVKESRLLLSLWKDSLQYRASFGQISNRISKDLGIESKYQKAPLAELIEEDLFQLTDKKIIHSLVDAIIKESISVDKVNQYSKNRENKFWYPDYQYFYESLTTASELITLVRKHASSSYASFEEGTQHYTTTLFEIDLVYRKFIAAYTKTNQNKILADLASKVEKVYANDWLFIYNNQWQTIVDGLDQWPTKSEFSQKQFFKNHVLPFTSKKQRLFVVISDALRFEIGAELHKKLQQEKRYQSSLDYMVSSLPSYTQLGMASLLPHKDLSFKKDSDTIVVDGILSNGTAGRTKILETNSGVRATAIKATEFMKMNSATDGRDFVKNYDLIYIYHNRIDKTGDDKTSEEKVFEAAEDELNYLKDILKKIGNVNGNNILVTADHGFLYQNKTLPESDFMNPKFSGNIIKENRRFVIGTNLKEDPAVKKFSAKNLNISSEVDILIPKSINRLKVKGAGSKFVHGGASMQEIIIPVLKVSKKRKDTTSQVEIDIIKSTDRITTNILAISFIQSNLVTDTELSRTIRAGIYAEDGELLSDHFNYVFDIDEGSERQREVKHRFQLSAKASGKYKNQRVKLLLQEPVDGSSKWKLYKDYYYTLNISFTNDFDDF